MDKIMTDVPYLEDTDINPDASLKPHVCRGKPVVLMIQGNFCGYCTKAKPDFVAFAKSNPSVSAVTIQMDGQPSEKKAYQMLSSVNKSPGVPSYLGFNRNGKFVAVHTGNRDAESLRKFSMTL